MKKSGGKRQVIQSIKKAPANAARKEYSRVVEMESTEPIRPTSQPKPVIPAPADGGAMVAYDDVVKLLKSIVKIKIGMLNATGPDKVEILRFETSKMQYDTAVNDAKETLKELAERALEGYIAPTTKISTEIYVDSEDGKERFFIAAITTDKLRKSFVSVFVNGKENVSQETLIAINNRLNPSTKA